jgi:polyhydroxybutyrate depolymerase
MTRYGLLLTIAAMIWPVLGVAEGMLREHFLIQSVAGKPLQRSYFSYVPKNLSPAPALVVVMHGSSSNARNVMHISKMNRVADEFGFIVAYPQGSQDANGDTFFNVGYEFHRHEKVDDVDFVVSLVGKLQALHNIDKNHVFATGLSNGGEMSYLLACHASELFRAVAPVAGCMMQNAISQCQPSRAIPILAISGTNDPITRYSGDLENADGWGVYLGQDDTIDFWVRQYGLERMESRPIANTHRPGNKNDSHIVFERYGQREQTGAKNDTTSGTAEIWFYRVVNGGHDWPGFTPDPSMNARQRAGYEQMGLGKNQDIDASGEIWRFFSKWVTQDQAAFEFGENMVAAPDSCSAPC